MNRGLVRAVSKPLGGYVRMKKDSRAVSAIFVWNKQGISLNRRIASPSEMAHTIERSFQIAKLPFAIFIS